MGATVIALPQASQTMLPTNIPYAEIELWKVDEAHILANSRNGLQVGFVRGIVRCVERLDLFKECGLSGIVKAYTKVNRSPSTL
jgi:hypothetical protein